MADPRGIIPAYAGSTVIVAFAAVFHSDHPRIRGEHIGRQIVLLAVVGSSPHTRGARRRRATRRAPPGDHPRIRGEHRLRLPDLDPRRGSSPHTRGAPPSRRQPPHGGRIIPAYAGSTPGRPSPAPIPRDHPRIRGEHADGDGDQLHAVGSSPHTRGALIADGVLTRMSRIIPAYAGSTPDAERHDPKGKDHPRIRGEHSVSACGLDDGYGSSPHTRGAHSAPAC